MKKLSVITINKDNADGLKQTIKSVVNQKTDDFEFIIIDGVSKDGSKQLIEQLAITDKRLTYWCSEADTGIYNAMNKGIEKAIGEYLLFLNSGDSLVDSEVVSDFISMNFEADFISGNQYQCKDGIIVNSMLTPICLDIDYFWWQSLPHQATFIRRDLFAKFGGYNEKLKLFSDWEFTLKALLLNNSSYVHYDRFISNFDVNGITNSLEDKVIELKIKERLEVFKLLPIIYSSFERLKEQNTILEDRIAVLFEEQKESVFKLIIKRLKRFLKSLL